MILDGTNWTSKEPPGGQTVEHGDQFQPELRDRQVGQLGSFAGAIYRNALPFTGGVRLQVCPIYVGSELVPEAAKEPG